VLEAAAVGLPVIFGPNYSKFKEARDLIVLKAGFSINDEFELKGITDTLIADEAFYNAASKKTRNYVEQHIGATKMIVDHLQQELSKSAVK
jgi:3-deoxy-D-manno-octulosonic-acid transferase